MSALRRAFFRFAGGTVAHVGFAFLAMGGWAVFANRHHALADMAFAGLVQGALSGAITLCLKKALERMSAHFLNAPASDEGYGRAIAALIVPPLVTATSIFTILVGAHALAGTPEIFWTIAVPFSVSTIYACIYTVVLWRGRKESA